MMEKVSLKIEAMTCGGCANKIKKAAEQVGANVTVDIPNRSVDVLYNNQETSLEVIKNAIEKIGYRVL
ncbi:heavy-metal-associated domain-containing protein [Bacillus sp. DX1.1]|uniref:heavy-metal-associated domain-containing protein n=2 Tax=unclassified Bacillus (in: firmicutes) TaxID=185979 RepID=UPI0025711B7D|nr:heavy-metal-associated domain-containing protein [Bacillus sp. DX3.1]MDM5154367.1 heavy-metal-associated domain-containing protein [Bacillus sp. DX1.1]WJE83277.1 heavy-metal-associated domain-containing protein [Bacillus sp. DX3.1]